MKALMEGQTGVSGDLIPSGDAEHLACQIKDDDVQLGVFHGVEFAWVRQHYPRSSRWSSPSTSIPILRALLVVRTDGKIAAPANLKGKVVALPRMSREHCRLFLERRCCPRRRGRRRNSSPRSARPPTSDDALDDVVDDKCRRPWSMRWPSRPTGRTSPAAPPGSRCCINPNCSPARSSPTSPARLSDKTVLTSFRNGLIARQGQPQGPTAAQSEPHDRLRGRSRRTTTRRLGDILKAYPPPAAK